MDALAGGVFLGLIARGLALFVAWCLSVYFLWQGARLFAELRRKLRTLQVCTKCGREVLASAAKFCGRCGGSLVKAA